MRSRRHPPVDLEAAALDGAVVTRPGDVDDVGPLAVVADPVVASAILDLLLHHATVINIKGKFYRLRGQEAALEVREVGSML